MIRHNHFLKNRRGQVLTEQAFVLAAIVGIVLVVISRMGFETTSVFDQLSKTFPRFSNNRSAKQPAGSRPKRAPSTAKAMAAAGTPAPAAGKAAAKVPGARARRGSGGGGLSQTKRARDTKRSGTLSWGVTSTSSSGSGALAVLIGR
jgi:hypothetical protein